MKINSLTTSILTPIEKYVEKELAHSKGKNFLKKQIIARAAHVALIPLSVAMIAIDGAVGTGAQLIGALPLGKYRNDLRNAAKVRIFSATPLIAKPFAHLLKAINPAAKIDLPDKFDGFFGCLVLPRIENKAYEFRSSDHALKRHIASRITYAIGIPLAVMTQIVDLSLGLIAATFSLLTLGKVKSINNFASKNVQLILPHNLFFMTMHVIHPWRMV
ncbi:MAG: hypothetical protein K0S07_1007 [Chlamydiales bacterium]|jgi:hypothetical protein|nr:hypothetical protein [Chlamydiales bacterium]